MQRLIFLSIILVSIVSCKKLSGENDYQLADNCKNFKDEIEQKIIKINVEKGVHFVAVDTTTCSLKVRYEADKVDLSWLYTRLDTLGYLAKVADSVLAPVDSLSKDSLTIDKEVKQFSEELEDASDLDDAPSN